jgi:hypothetical protein
VVVEEGRPYGGQGLNRARGLGWRAVAGARSGAQRKDKEEGNKEEKEKEKGEKEGEEEKEKGFRRIRRRSPRKN